MGRARELARFKDVSLFTWHLLFSFARSGRGSPPPPVYPASAPSRVGYLAAPAAASDTHRVTSRARCRFHAEFYICDPAAAMENEASSLPHFPDEGHGPLPFKSERPGMSGRGEQTVDLRRQGVSDRSRARARVGRLARPVRRTWPPPTSKRRRGLARAPPPALSAGPGARQPCPAVRVAQRPEFRSVYVTFTWISPV